MKVKRGFCIGFILACALPPLCRGFAAEPVAMVTDLKGIATLVENGNRSRLFVLAYLVPGVEIQAEAGAQLVVTFFPEAREYSFIGPVRIAIGRDTAQVLQGNKGETRVLSANRANAAQKFEPMQRERMAMLSFEMRSSPHLQIRLLGPVNAQVLSATPEFSWTVLPGVSRYRFALMNGSGVMLHEATVDSTSYRLPQSAALHHGEKYNWKVEGKPQAGKPISASGTFTMIDAEGARHIIAAKPGPEASFSDRIFYAIALESEGLGFDARAEWRALAHDRPDDATLKRWAER